MTTNIAEAAYQDAVTHIYARHLPIYPARIDDGLFDLGADSLIVVNLVQDLEQSFEVALPFDVLIDVQSVREMASWLAMQHAPVPAQSARA